MGKGRLGLGLLNPSRPWPTSMGDGARELGREGEGLCPGSEGLPGTVRGGSRALDLVLGVCGGIQSLWRGYPRGICRGLDPVEFGGSGLRGNWISRELEVRVAWMMRRGIRGVWGGGSSWDPSWI